MDIHEYQAKQLLRPYGLASPPGECAFTAEEAELAARRIGGSRWVVKAQILAGDRGLAGGVKMVASEPDVREAARAMLGIEAGHAPDRRRRRARAPGVRGSRLPSRERALPRPRPRPHRIARHPRRLRRRRDGHRVGGRTAAGADLPCRRRSGGRVNAADARRLAMDIGLGERHAAEAERLMIGLYDAFVAYDASLIEINPLALTRDGALLALDAKMSIDDNALFRHRDIEDLREREHEGRLDRARHGFNYIALDGDVGCVVNGAGLAMATMDILKLHGGAPANFLDIPPAAGRDRITAACRLVLENPRVKVMLVNIVGGGDHPLRRRRRGARIRVPRRRAAGSHRRPLRRREPRARTQGPARYRGPCGARGVVRRRRRPGGAGPRRENRDGHPRRRRHPGHRPGHHREAGDVPCGAVHRLRHPDRRGRHPRQGRQPAPVPPRLRSGRGRGGGDRGGRPRSSTSRPSARPMRCWRRSMPA